MEGRTRLVVGQGDEELARKALSSLVMAWARDSVTGEPRYILELDASRSGARCGCECASCGLPLVAVNAAKETFQKRPHFRHPAGAPKHECAVLAARTALLRQLCGATLELPSRAVTGQTRGLSGATYRGSASTAGERVWVRDIDFADPAAALLTLSDGRQLRVRLVGTAANAREPDEGRVATVFLGIDDPEIAAMEPQELLQRLALIGPELTWLRHWDDHALQAQADTAAADSAVKHLDATPLPIELPPETDPALKRQAVVLMEVRRVLEEEGQLTAPGLEVDAELTDDKGRSHRARWTFPEHLLTLTHLRLDEGRGRLLPDLVAVARQPDGRYLNPLFVQVTLSPGISGQEMSEPPPDRGAAVEIDLRRTPGPLTRAELRHLVVADTHCKRWLRHPALQAVRDALDQKLRESVSIAEGQPARAGPDEQPGFDALTAGHTEIQLFPAPGVIAEYLRAATALIERTWEMDPAYRGPPRDRGSIWEEHQAAQVQVLRAARSLEQLGYSGADSPELLGRDGILSRLLSIKLDRGVGSRFASAGDMLAGIRFRSKHLSDVSLYFIAVQAYRPALTDQEESWLEAWRAEVRASIKAGDRTYVRYDSFDPLLSVLFPEMAPGLAKPGGKRKAGSRPGTVRPL